MTWYSGGARYRSSPLMALADTLLIHGHTRRDLLAERFGHGRFVTGGLRGPEVTVDNAAELAAALQLDGPAWITFPHGFNDYITPDTYLDAKSDKTVDGRGSGVILENYPIRARGSNIIVTDLTVDFHRVWGNLDPTTVTHFEGPGHLEFGYPDFDLQQFWAHHCHFKGMQVGDGSYTDWLDEGVNCPRRTQYVTQSWNWYERMNKCALVGNNDTDPNEGGDFVTWHHNFFDTCEERQPLLRFHRNFHAFNNWWKNWTISGTHGIAIQNQKLSAILIENNVFDNPTSAGTVYGGSDQPGDHKHVGNLLSGSAFKPSDINPSSVPVPDYPYTPDTANQALRDALTSGVGPR